MNVEIINPFSVDGRRGDTHYSKGQIVPSGKQSWIDKGLAVAVKPKTLPTKKSAD